MKICRLEDFQQAIAEKEKSAALPSTNNPLQDVTNTTTTTNTTNTTTNTTNTPSRKAADTAPPTPLRPSSAQKMASAPSTAARSGSKLIIKNYYQNTTTKQKQNSCPKLHILLKIKNLVHF